MLSLCAEDVVVMPPDQPVVQGRQAFRAWLEQFPSIVEANQTFDNVDGQGDLAVARGTTTAKLEVEGRVVTNTGKWLCLLRKQADGSWLLAGDSFNWDQPMIRPGA
jgi:ketosteroid isomerase-like protein